MVTVEARAHVETDPTMLAVLLVVDENRNIREFCKRELERDGYHVLVAGNTQEALRLLGEIRADLVVVDPADVPGMDSLVFLRNVRRRGIPVVVHTGRVASPSDDLPWTAEARVEKNGDLTELKREIEKAVVRKAAGSPPREGCGSMRPQRPSERYGNGGDIR
jgi:DNA-binding response OmpR family regulator